LIELGLHVVVLLSLETLSLSLVARLLVGLLSLVVLLLTRLSRRLAPHPYTEGCLGVQLRHSSILDTDTVHIEEASGIRIADQFIAREASLTVWIRELLLDRIGQLDNRRFLGSIFSNNFHKA